MNFKSSILITGAGSGIGRAISIKIATNHPEIPLVLTGRNINKLQETVSLLPKNYTHEIFSLDVTSIESIYSFKQFLIKNNMTFKALVMNAGIGGENKYGENDRWDEIIATNLTGPYRLTQELLPFLMKDQNEFRNILFISSILARLGVPQYTAYCSSKAGLLGLMRSLAAELASKNILVNAICPGWVDTQMSIDGLRDISAATGKTLLETTREQLEMVPLRKMSKPEEIAEMVNFLINGLQRSITGQTIDINNGALMP